MSKYKITHHNPPIDWKGPYIDIFERDGKFFVDYGSQVGCFGPFVNKEAAEKFVAHFGDKP